MPSSYWALTSSEGPGGVLVIPLERAAGPLGLPFLAGLRLPYGRAPRVACPDPAPSPSWPCAPGLAAPCARCGPGLQPPRSGSLARGRVIASRPPLPPG